MESDSLKELVEKLEKQEKDLGYNTYRLEQLKKDYDFMFQRKEYLESEIDKTYLELEKIAKSKLADYCYWKIEHENDSYEIYKRTKFSNAFIIEKNNNKIFFYYIYLNRNEFKQFKKDLKNLKKTPVFWFNIHLFPFTQNNYQTIERTYMNNRKRKFWEKYIILEGVDALKMI